MLTKRIFFNIKFKLIVFIILIMAVFGYSNSRFIFVQAYNNRVNIVPGMYLLEDENSELNWKNIDNVFNQNLSEADDISSFNASNSASIIWGDIKKFKVIPSLPAAKTEMENAEKDIDGELNNDELDINSEEEKNIIPVEIIDNLLEKATENINFDDNAVGEVTTPEPIVNETNIDENNDNEVVNEEIDNLEPNSSEKIDESSDLLDSSSTVPPDKTIDNVSTDDEVSLFKSLFNRVKPLFDFVPMFVSAEENIVVEDNKEKDLIKKSNFSSSIIFSDFFVPLEYQKNGIGNINLRLSLAGESELEENEIIIEYNIGKDWENLSSLKFDNNISNYSNGDYFNFSFLNKISWEDLKNLQIRIKYQGSGVFEEKSLELYLDALWLEIDYNDISVEIKNDEEEIDEEEIDEEEIDEEEIDEEEIDEEESIITVEEEFELNMVSERQTFGIDKLPNFEFRFKKRRSIMGSLGAELLGIFFDEYKDIKISAKVNNEQDLEESNLKINYLSDGKFNIEFIKKPRHLQAGKNSLEIVVQNEGKDYTFIQDFIWGVLAFNTNKSVYLPEEIAYLQMGVLDDNGDTICDADLRLEITAPDGGIATLSTDNGLIIRNPDCGPNNIINTPDYYSYYGLAGLGLYQVKLIAQTINGEREISDSFEVRELIPFEIERIGPTRIYPVADYDMKFKIKPNVDFKGSFTEIVPDNFKIIEQKQDGAVKQNINSQINENDGEKKIIWNVDWQIGEEYILSYAFDAPNISPEFYLLGPAKIKGVAYVLDGDDILVPEFKNFEELRQWQIASDAATIVQSAIGTPVSASTYSATFSSAPTEGNVIIMIAIHRINNASFNTPTGFTETIYSDTSWYLDVGMWHKVAGSSEDTTFSITKSGRNQSGMVVLFEVSGLDIDDLVDVTSSNDQTGSNSNIAYTGATAQSTADGFAIAAIGWGDNAFDDPISSDWSSDSSDDYTQHSWTEWSVGSDGSLGIAYTDITAAATQGVTLSLSGDNEQRNSVLAVFNLAPPIDVAVSATGTQTASMDIPSANNYVGGVFAITENIATSSITSITITETGTVDAQNDISNIKLYYDLDTSYPYDCISESYSASDSRFGATSTSFDAANGTSTFSGTLEISTTSTMCVYTILDIGAGATPYETLEIEIEDPSEDIVLSDGIVGPSTSVEIATTTTLHGPIVSIFSNQQYKSDVFTTIANQGWTNENEVNLSAMAMDALATGSVEVDLYFELMDESESFTAATSVPSDTCTTATAYAVCNSKIWTVSASSLSWYNNNWNYRKKITINASQVATSTSNFQVLAITTDSDLRYSSNGGHVEHADAYDIVVTDSDAVTPLNYEREYYDPATGKIVLWIETDISTSSNKELYIYYGNSGVSSDQSTTTGVWDKNYVLVQHFNESPDDGAAGHLDSSENGYNGTPYNFTDSGGGSTDATSTIDGADDYAGDDDYVSIALPTVFNSIANNDFTVSFWMYPRDVSGQGTWIRVADIRYDNSNFVQFLFHDSAGNFNYRVEDVGTQREVGVDSPIFADTWYYVTGTWDASANSMNFYLDSVSQSGGFGGTAGNGDLQAINIGRRSDAAADTYFDGIIDEFRVSDIVRDSGWIETQYNNQKFVDSFLNFGAEESSPMANGVVNITSIPDRGSSTNSALGYKWQVFACNNSGDCSAWNDFNSTLPNFKIDNTLPTAPGNLTLATSTATSITLNFGAQTTEANFNYYKIFYKDGVSGVDITDTEHNDSNLNYIDYNSATSTMINDLESDTQYVINIFAYDLAGNKTGATEIIVTTLSAPHARARSIMFNGGFYSSSDGLTGQLSNTNQSFETFNFKIAETEVDIKNAYVIFESQFAAYTEPYGDWSGYTLAFDACQEPCTADAWGSNTITQNDNTVLAYDEDGSNQLRLLFDVTDEVQLAAYTGDGTNMQAQIGYNIKIDSGIATNTIANARARLVVTYTFNNDDSTNITNTVIYPLDSTAAGDSGTRQSGNSNCSLGSCPTFSYNMEIPEVATKLSQWFNMSILNDVGGTNDTKINVNIDEVGVDSDTMIHEAFYGGTQSGLITMTFPDVFGFVENTAHTLEYHVYPSGTYYLWGGEVVETYVAPKSASIKTRTVSYPIGVIMNGATTTPATSTVSVYFPENGTASGIVDIKSAWFRILGNSRSDGSLDLRTKVGDNSLSSTSTYDVQFGSYVPKSAFTIYHIIPSADYNTLEAANASIPVLVSINAQTSSANFGGVSAELMITYTYSDESSGYLSSLNLFGGQSDVDGNSASTSATIANSVFPELRGTKIMREAALLNSNLFSDSDGIMPGATLMIDANIATSSPICVNAFKHVVDNMNSFGEFYRNVSASMDTTNDQSYTACYSNTGSDTSLGAKMNAIWKYVYQWDAPPVEFTQNDWRWYENIDAIEPVVAKAAENTSINGINIGDILRLRINLAVTKTDLSTSTQIFKLQFAQGSDCTAISSTSWSNIGGAAGSEAWIGYNNPDPADGTTLLSTSLLLASSTKSQSYEEYNSTASNPRGVQAGGYGEWDWAIYNNSATSSSNYCFRMANSAGIALDDYLSDSYPKLITAASNTAPINPFSLGQYKNDGITPIANLSWINENTVKLKAVATDPNIGEVISLYFELASSTASFTTATTVPNNACSVGTPYTACVSKIWVITSTTGDYRSNAFIGTTTIPSILDSAEGYKWQALACDDGGACSNWAIFNASKPNFLVDITPPSAPGNLSFSTSTPLTITLNLGASTTEDNFNEYKIFYKVGTAGVTENDTEFIDVNLGFQDYNGANSVVIDSLSANTAYIFNIWAYDMAGNSASATIEAMGTTTTAYNPPTGFIDNLSAQKINGTGIVDMVILVDDPDNDNTLRAKLFYEAGDTCNFITETNATIDETDANTIATYGDPDVDTNSEFQIGTTSAWIITAPGSNYVFFDWQSKIDIPTADGDYCLGLVVNDGGLNQVATHTKVLTIDNINPTAPGSLSTSTKNYNSITLAFGAESTDTRFDQYKIFYKEGTSGVTENDQEFNKTDDSNLDLENYGTAATTTITGLTPNTTYVFNIWAYDIYGNKASSSKEFSIKTNAKPVNISADNQYRSNGITVIANGSWIDDDKVVFSASAHDQDAGDLMSFYFELIPATGTFSSIANPPSSVCASGTPYMSCADAIWIATTTTSSLPAGWYSEDWLYRKQITISANQVESTENNFVVLATTTDSDLASYARFDGYDILFTDSSGTSTLLYEREYYNSSTGELAVWIKTDVSSTTDTILYMYYGNSGVNSDPATSTGIWDNNYRGVWHLEESVVDESNQTNAHIDSTINNNDGDQDGNNEILGQIYRGQEFDGINDNIKINDNSSLDITDAVTLEFWINGTTQLSPISSSTVFTASGTDAFVVPFGVTEITVKAWGAGGAGGAGGSSGGGGEGGGGAFASSTIAVTPLETLNVYVGGSGGYGVPVGGGGGGGGGGGCSEIKRGTTPLIVAAGGGGAGGGDNSSAVEGGDGGGGGGVTGTSGNASSNAGGGGGGTQSAGGAGGTGGENSGTAGASDAGGEGGNGGSSGSGTGSGASGGVINGGDAGIGDSAAYGGGGGGGCGYYGGGGGSSALASDAGGGGGGGGSSYASSTISGSGTTAGNSSDLDYADFAGQGGDGGEVGNNGNIGNPGRIVISYNLPPSAVVGKKDTYEVVLDSNQNIIGRINGQALTAPVTSAWNHVALTYNRYAGGSEEIKLYINGVQEDTGDYSAAIDSNSYNLYIGDNLNGIIDEVRLSAVARDKNWIKTQYNNQKSVNDFLTFSNQSTVTSYFESTLVITIPDNPDYSSGWKWQVMACDDDNDCTAWDDFNSITPNFKIDTTDPSAPGQLSEYSKNSNSISLNFGAQTDEDNFIEYKIYYSTSSSITESDYLHSSSTDSDLGFIDYNNTTYTTVTGLAQNTAYYFSIYAYDVVGHKASSSVVSISTITASSSPGVAFYTKGTRVLYYNVWDGSSWGGEQSGPNLGSTANFSIRHIRTVRSDSGGTIAILAKASSTVSVEQEWWGTIYRFAADDFVSTKQLGATSSSGVNAQLMTGCMAALSGGEFFVVRNNNTSDGTLIYSWNATDGWVAENSGPNPVAVLNGCNLIRRPGTDNYLLMTFDDDNDVGSSYYYGGSTYANSWTIWTEHSTIEEDSDNFVGQAFFDPSDNTRGALSYSNSSSNHYTYAKYFICDNNSINYGAAQSSPISGLDDWNDDYVHGEFASNPGGTGVAYFIGRDIDRELNVYSVDVTSPTITWATTTNGDNISGGELYVHTNDSQKPFASLFYKDNKAIVVWNERNDATPKYRILDASTNSLDSSNSAVTGAGSNLWNRVRLYEDTAEDEFIAIYQNDDIDYAAVFFDGSNDVFYSTGNQAWSEIVTNSGALEEDDENISFAYAGYNSAPSNPNSLGQYKNNGITVISNNGWTNETAVKFNAAAIDVDTYEIITLYLNLVTNIDDFTTSTVEANFNACVPTALWESCNSKIWTLASSTAGDYSVVPFTATATISSLASSTIGYKWQAIACDDDGDCSSWTIFNATQPNFYVDDTPPTAPGNLTDVAVTSNSVTLQFGVASVEDNFSEYKIFYKIGSSGVAESDSAWTQVDDNHLDDRLYDGFTKTTITGLSSSTQYVFNIFAYDLAGNTASATLEVSTTTSALPNVTQTSYLLENDDGTNVNLNTAEVAASTTLSNVVIGERVNVRIQIENDGGDTTGNKVYKLQYENYTDTPGIWNDVGAATDISYSGGLSGSSGQTINSSKASANSNTWKDGVWYENTNVTGLYSLINGQYTEFVFVIETSNAATGTTYRLRLYNNTDNQVLDDYDNYPAIIISTTDIKRFSKGFFESLPSDTNDLTYYLDPEGYADILSDDSARDMATSSAQYPVFMFATKHVNNTDAASSTWNGQSSVAASTNNIVLQIYRFGSTNSWVTVDTENAVSANTDFNLTATVNASLSEYYGNNNWIYWRVYQAAGSQTLKTDYYSANFSSPVPNVEQIHYRWRNDDGSETAATWLEAEDTGNPTLGNALRIGSTTRLRIAISNTAAGNASNYTYRLEYASSSDGCASDPGNWTTVPINNTTEHFEMVASSNFNNSDPTTATTSNSEGYNFIAGDMVEDPSNTTGNITLTENDYTEVEYMIEVTSNATIAETYCFRVTNSGTALNNYNIYPVLTLGGSTNVAPSFTAGPFDGGSASTSPTNYGNNVSFSATASDTDGDNYYLAICQSNSITSGNDTYPSCNGGAWCISSSTASGVEASCNYTTATSSETLAWYAFVCDKVSGFGISKCSNVSQGAGSAINDSPFVINHPPDFTSVVTTVNNINPGGTTTITTYVTDNDIADTADTIDLFVCTQNSAVAGTGCAGAGNQELCSEIATSSPNASCTYSTSTPATAGDWTYYAFIFDSHNLAATDNSRSSTYTINNVAPVLGTLVLNAGSDISLNIKGAGDTSVSTINSSVIDYNGCSSLVSATAVIYFSNVSGGSSCTENDNNCYQIGVSDCVVSGCSGPTDISATYTCTANLKYFAIATDNSSGNPNESYNWLSYINVYDGSNYSATTSLGVEIMTSLALEVEENIINFGNSMTAGENTGDANSTTTVVNIGNSPIDTNISGTDLAGNPDGTIQVDKIKWELTNFDYPFSGTPLDTTTAKAEVVAPKATTTAFNSEDEILWGIGIPFTASSSIYTGNNNFSVVLDNDDW